jgi:hypothetical protein
VEIDRQVNALKKPTHQKKKRKKLMSNGSLPCIEKAKDPSPPLAKKQRITEVERHAAHTGGGRYDRDKPQDLVFAASQRPAAESPRPLPESGAMALQKHNPKYVETYEALLASCKDLAEKSSNREIVEESPSIIEKLEELVGVDEMEKDEIDWFGAIDEARYICSLWELGKCAGATAFTISIKERDDILVSLKGILDDINELERVKEVWHSQFGNDAVDYLNEIFYNIPPEIATQHVVELLKYVFYKITATYETALMSIFSIG